jgi:hypothetical protein
MNKSLHAPAEAIRFSRAVKTASLCGKWKMKMLLNGGCGGTVQPNVDLGLQTGMGHSVIVLQQKGCLLF